MQYRSFVQALTAAATLYLTIGLPGAVPAQQAASERPNIVIVMADDKN